MQLRKRKRDEKAGRKRKKEPRDSPWKPDVQKKGPKKNMMKEVWTGVLMYGNGLVINHNDTDYEKELGKFKRKQSARAT